MKIKKTYLAIITIILLTITSCFAQTPTQTLAVSGLKENVTVRRDGRGIPYIEAKSEDDLFFAQGYVMASDRLWQMDLYRRVARGETAEIFGKAVLEEDKRWRKFGFAQIAEENLKYTAPEVVRALENYSRGVNAYISTLDDKSLPPEFRILQFRPKEWKPSDSVVIGAILADGLSTTWQSDLMKASLQDLPKDKLDLMFAPDSQDDVLLYGKDVQSPKSKVQSAKSEVQGSRFKVQSSRLTTHDSRLTTLELIAQAEKIRKNSLERIGVYAENLSASNNWVISGKRTLDGKPILANDPHLQAAQPPIWYLVNLDAPNFHAAGVTIPGSPGIILGHNENIAWGATNVGPDVQDLYLETFNDKNQYKTPKGWETAKVRTEEIKVRANPLKPETTIEKLEVVNTRNGVVFVEDSGKKYALKWTVFDPKVLTIDAFYFINRAKNWDDFQNALRKYGGAAQNFIYADTQGNIGWYAAGKIPIRKTGDGSLPYNGATDAGDWTGFIPFENLPHLYNPPEGFIVTANQRTVGTSYKYHDIFARIYVPFRAQRIYNLIKANPKMTLDASSDIQMDTFSILNSRLAREIVKQKAASDETLKILQSWDGKMSPDSQAALLIEYIRRAFRNRLLENALGADRAKRIGWANDGNWENKILMSQPKEWLPKEFSSYAELFKASEIDAREALIKIAGIDRAKWTWGAVNKVKFPHTLAVVPLIGLQFDVKTLPLKGSGGTAASPNVGQSVSMRFLADLTDWDLTRHIIPTGESGDPKSPHWADQLDNWYNGNTPIFPFSKSAVEKAAKEALVMTPTK
ncbi:penicillin acylase family protein [soil metagenome]